MFLRIISEWIDKSLIISMLHKLDDTIFIVVFFEFYNVACKYSRC
ncbi:Uncharacterised protein [Vibrio cholerae]|nr:hypothetical protein VP96_03664 [Vibrio cholerae]CSD53113.1 Uncharacterised protein [Vibrio cholerae]